MGFFEDILSGIGLIKSDQQQELERIAQEVSRAQADRINQGTQLRQRAEGELDTLMQGGAPPVFRLGTRPEDGTDIEAFMGQLGHNAPFNKLLELIGVGEGNVGSANQALSGSIAMEQKRQEDLENLTRALLMGLG